MPVLRCLLVVAAHRRARLPEGGRGAARLAGPEVRDVASRRRACQAGLEPGRRCGGRGDGARGGLEDRLRVRRQTGRRAHRRHRRRQPRPEGEPADHRRLARHGHGDERLRRSRSTSSTTACRTYGPGTTTAFVQAARRRFPVRHGGDVFARPERAHQHLRRADDRADRDQRDHGTADGDVAAQHRHRLDELRRPHRVFHARSHERRADAFRAGHDGRRRVAVPAHAATRWT